MYVICSKKVWPPPFHQWNVPFISCWLKDKKRSLKVSERRLWVKASRRTSYWQNHLSCLPSLFFLSLSYWYTGILFFSPSNPSSLFSSPSLALRLPPSLHWQGLYGFSNKRDLLFLLFFLLNLLPPCHFLPLLPPLPSFDQSFNSPFFLTSSLFSSSIYSAHINPLIPSLPPLPFSFVSIPSPPIFLLCQILLSTPPRSLLLWSSHLPFLPPRQIATYPFFYFSFFFLQLSEVEFRGEMSRARSQRASALSLK